LRFWEGVGKGGAGTRDKEGAMASGTQEAPREVRKFTSPLSALVWFFRRSRDGWKAKYQSVQGRLRRMDNEVRDVRKSREKWKREALELQAEVRRLRSERRALQEEFAEARGGEKKG
jgi:uncharacterized coiled-coil DUF342 family protein